MLYIPRIYQEFKDYWNRYQKDYIDLYTSGEYSFIPNLLPEIAVSLSTKETLRILRERLGNIVDLALDTRYTDIHNLPATIPDVIQSPVNGHSNGQWLKKSNMVGINVRTVHNFWNIIKYMLTIPEAQDSVHLLPIWEPGVVESLYGMSSWHINNEFYSDELAQAVPHLNTVEKQLRAVVNLLHAMGKTVGMDVIPHTDRYSEMALTNPAYFEWLQREDLSLIDHSDDLYIQVEDRIMDFLKTYGPAVDQDNIPTDRGVFFSPAVKEDWRALVLFGHPYDPIGRSLRRGKLVRHLYDYGYEPVPATMAPPFRGLEVDPDEGAKTEDEYGMVWRDYRITQPESMSRVFGPLARYKFYGRLNNNQDWQVDFANPRVEVWEYVCEHYAEVQQRYSFDFMRGDMSHVQMRTDGVPEEIDDFYDILGSVKNHIRKQTPHFGYFAETFLPPRDIFGYGEEIDHLEASYADTTLGDLQSTVVGSGEFMQRFRQYDDILRTRSCVPSFTIMTGDKDDPRFDAFYVKGNEVRLFIALFLSDMPAYMGLGFETRDVHYAPVPNEHYTKLFVFHEQQGHKARSGDYIWGKNGHLYHNLTRIRQFADRVYPVIQGRNTRWLLPPDPTAMRKLIAWTQDDTHPDYLFIANLDIDNPTPYSGIPGIPGPTEQLTVQFNFSTEHYITEKDEALRFNGFHYRLEQMAPGEGRAYRLNYPEEI